MFKPTNFFKKKIPEIEVSGIPTKQLEKKVTQYPLGPDMRTGDSNANIT
tara:strand:- start:557 stop:703 length:147 start_codon:yes stop_codon:yes gene_type:complete